MHHLGFEFGVLPEDNYVVLELGGQTMELINNLLLESDLGQYFTFRSMVQLIASSVEGDSSWGEALEVWGYV